MKKPRINVWSRGAYDRIMNKTSNNYGDVNFFNWRTSEQGYAYWSKKYRDAVTRYKHKEASIFEGVLTEEDYAYFRVMGRKGFRKDTFLSSPAQKEYVKFAEELPFE